ncbi:dynein axonemal intermediate chain 7-like [Sylvia atricapilla]|uniref:dynein axonemal intermediate chain 7-like n=1 Tax=Sylvia atricapilla TaxID=48155 RepID=UPI0033997DBE
MAKTDVLVTAGRAEFRFPPTAAPTRPFQRPTSAPGAGWSPGSLRHRVGEGRRPHSPLRHCPDSAARAAQSSQRCRGGLPRNAAAPAGGSAASGPSEPRRPHGAGPGSRCPSGSSIRTSPRRNSPFPERDTRAKPPRAGPASPASSRSPGLTSAESGSVRSRGAPTAGRHRDAPPGAAPQVRSEEDALLREEAGGREEAPRVADLQQLLPLGGVYHIDALQLPPQVQDVGDWSMVELLDVGLELYPYSPEEAEDGTQAAVQITLRLPDNVIYFQVPVVARWDPAGQQWRTDGITNITHEAEEKSITFGMCAFYTVAFLQDAHLNLPYQAWELHPTGVDEGLFTITAVFATIQIQIKVPSITFLIKHLQLKKKKKSITITMSLINNGGCFHKSNLSLPCPQGSFEKSWSEHFPSRVLSQVCPCAQEDLVCLLCPCALQAALAEVKAYEQMALLAAAFAFAHSKWNGEAGPEQVVFKVSEHLTAGAAKDNDWSLCMFSGEKVQNLKLTETSEAFSEELKEESEFHSTLYHMLKDSASSEAMDKVGRAGFLFIDSVYQLLLATRVLAYS